MWVAQREPRIKALHVLEGVNGHPPFADLAEHPVGIAVEAVKGRTVEGGAEPNVFLMSREVVEALVAVFSQAEAGEEAGGFFGFRISDFGFRLFLKVHLPVGAVGKR